MFFGKRVYRRVILHGSGDEAVGNNLDGKPRLIARVVENVENIRINRVRLLRIQDKPGNHVALFHQVN